MIAMRLSNVFASIVLNGCALFGVSAYAADGAKEAGPHFSLSVSEGRNDNVTLAPSSAGRIDSNVLAVNPAFQLLGKDGLNSFALEYDVLHEKYSDYEEADHTDHSFSSKNYLDFNYRNALALEFTFNKYKSVQDSLNREDPLEDSGNRSSNAGAGFNYRFGAFDAAGRLELAGSYNRISFHNNLETSSLNKFRERDIRASSATLFVRAAPKTYTLFEVEVSDTNYHDNKFEVNSDEISLLVGATWEATGRTTGTVKLGLGRKAFDARGKGDAEYTRWEANIQWVPLEYSTFVLATSRLLNDGRVREDYVESSEVSVAWKHSWRPRISSTLKAAYLEQDYYGSFNDGRKDKTQTGKIQIDYEWRKWLDIGTYYEVQHRGSSFGNETYAQKVFGAEFTFSL